MTFTVSQIVSDETLDCIITIESAGNPRAKAATSSATGLFQFLDRTWLGTVAKHRPDVYTSTPRAQLLAKRLDAVFCIEMGARFTEDNWNALGGDPTGGDLYLAHFLGIGDARDFYRADPSTPANKLVKQQVIDANRSIFIVGGQMQTAGQIRAWAARKMAKAGGRGWIKKYWPKDNVIPMPKPRIEEEAAEDIPDPQDAPAQLPEPTAVVPVDAEPEVVKKQVEESASRDSEPSGSWIKRKWKGITSTIGGLFGTVGAAIFDWRIVATIIGGIFLTFIIVLIIMGPGEVRSWIRKQVS